jgi:tRNA threonylcarbamoyladenosine biosynthesis protein TsaE
MTVITTSVADTIQAGKDFAAGLNPDSTVLMYGEMGAGKTHFVKGIAQGLAIKETITSPTFALVNDYGRLIHFDLFRIHSEEDLYAIGYYDYSGIIVVEWAENVPGLEKNFEVRIEKIDENTREITWT